MRYQILIPPTPLDPQELGVVSLQGLYEALHCAIECDLEEEAEIGGIAMSVRFEDPALDLRS